MKGKKAWLVGGGAVVLVLIIITAALGNKTEVEAVRASRGTFTLAVEETGYVQAVNDHQVEAAQVARVVELLAQEGDKVKAGQTLMRLDSPELTAETASLRAQISQTRSQLEAGELGLESLQAELKLAESNLARQKVLLDAGALASTEYEQAELQVTRLRKTLAGEEAGVAGLNSQMSSLGEMMSAYEAKTAELQVVSPAAGTVLDVPVKAGQVVSLGTPLIQVGSTGQLEIKTELLSDEIRRVKTGQAVRISAPVLGNQVLSGKVSRIYPQAYEKTSALGVIQRRVPVIITVNEIANLRSGFEVRVAIETVRKEGVILLPRESVRLSDKGEYKVWAVVDGKIEEKVIKVGEKSQQWVEVTDGTKVGQTVVRDGSQELKIGTRVKPLVSGQKL